ncbi:MAG: ParA family partition ATPase [Pseudomonadota bacterium]
MTGKIITVAQQKGGSGKTTIAANLAVAFAKAGKSVALMDTDPQGSLGRWFMTRHEAGLAEGIDFSTASAWGVTYECDKLAKTHDVILIDTPPKIDSDLRPALRASDLIVVPVSASQVDVWATEGVLELARREDRDVLVVLNRVKAATKVLGEVSASMKDLKVPQAKSVLGQRVAYAETIGQGKGVLERAKGAWTEEVTALAKEVAKAAGIKLK